MAGSIKKNQKVTVVKQKDGSTFNDTVVQVLEFDRLAKKEVESISAGDVCAIVGLDEADIGDTICTLDIARALPPLTIDEPTLDMVFKVNDSPFASKEGKPLTSRELRARLDRELQHNVALRVRPGERESDFVVSGRGLLHLGVLLETIRREGSEIAVGKPLVIVKEINGQKHEPYEYLVVEVPNEHQNTVMRLVLERQSSSPITACHPKQSILPQLRNVTLSSNGSPIRAGKKAWIHHVLQSQATAWVGTCPSQLV